MLYIAYGSICELETQMLLSVDLNDLYKDKIEVLKTDIAEVERMLMARINSLEKKSNVT